jgi:hypothetical protein
MQTADVKLGPADTVWIIDGSASMLDEFAAVEQNITAFVDSHNALQLLVDLYPDYQPFLRPEAALHFVVVTDDESFVLADDFKLQMEQRAGKKFIFHAIASEDVDGFACVGACGLPIVCGGFAPGRQYYALADATGGEKISICISDWSQVFGPLQRAVIESAPLPCDYAIPAPPAGEMFDANKVNLEFSALASVKMCPAGCQAISGGGTIQIKLGCETVPLIVL